MDSEQEQRRHRLADLINGEFGRDNDLVARVIEERTGDKVSVRSIQAWLIAPNRRSSRNCPPGAIKALEDYLADPANREYLKEHAAIRERTLAAAQPRLAWSNEVRSNRAVEFATYQLEDKERKRQAWKDAAGVHLGPMLFEMQRGLLAELASHRKTLVAINEGLRTSSSFEEFKLKVQELVQLENVQEFFVRDAERDIENNANEFARPDGVIQNSAHP